MEEKNISKWRRTVCGDLSSAFKPYNSEQYELPKYIERDAYIERIHKANFKAPPKPAMTLQPADTQGFQVSAFQESGTRPSCPLPYELEASIEAVANGAKISLEAGNKRNKDKAAGGAFNLYSYGANPICRAYAVSPGDEIQDAIPIESECHVRIDGPNGFMRELRSRSKPVFNAKVRAHGEDVSLTLVNNTDKPLEITLTDKSYGDQIESVALKPHRKHTLEISTKPGKHWYDITASASDTQFRFAGRIETGEWGISDPAMG